MALGHAKAGQAAVYLGVFILVGCVAPWTALAILAFSGVCK